MDKAGIGRRVRAALNEAFGDSRPDKVVAADVGMTPDAFSRAIKGERAFSSLELARLAGVSHADVHYLITGEPDPNRVVFAARHDYDPETGQRHIPGEEDDAKTLEAVRLAYTQAALWLKSFQPQRIEDRQEFASRWPLSLPTDPHELRALLGADFVRVFADRLEQVLGIDVLRIQNLSTDYSFTLGSQRVILLRAQGNWFRSNFSLAHELAHLALGHHDERGRASAAEAAANQFASELLLPAGEVRAINWEAIDETQLASRVWEWGVSNQSLSVRLNALGLKASSEVLAALDQPTQRLLRKHPEVIRGSRTIVVPASKADPESLFAVPDDPISARMRDAAERRIPAALIRAHLDGIAVAKISKGTLAWLLETPSEELDVDEPAAPQSVSLHDMASDLGLVGI